MSREPVNEAVCSYCDAYARYYISPDVALGHNPAYDKYLLPSSYACKRHLSMLVELATLYTLGHEAFHANRDMLDVEITVLPAFLPQSQV